MLLESQKVCSSQQLQGSELTGLILNGKLTDILIKDRALSAMHLNLNLYSLNSHHQISQPSLNKQRATLH